MMMRDGQIKHFDGAPLEWTLLLSKYRLHRHMREAMGHHLYRPLPASLMRGPLKRHSGRRMKAIIRLSGEERAAWIDVMKLIR
jgi:hypothetical protein